MNQNRKYALMVAATMPLIALASYAAVVVCSAKPDLLPPLLNARDDLQYFPPGPEFKLTRQVQALERAKLEQQSREDPTESGDRTDTSDSEVQIKLTGGVIDENAETTSETQDSLSAAARMNNEPDGIDKWILTPKASRNRNLGID